MSRIILVCGPNGAGKTTYSVSLCKEINAIKFSIDPWMNTLFAKDITSLDYEWVIERLNRCYEQIWDVSEQVLGFGGSVVLDLGFFEKQQRQIFIDKSKTLNITPEVHYLDAPIDLRKRRVRKRNLEKDPSVYIYDVSEAAFEYMEARFEKPDDEEMLNGKKIDTEKMFID